MDFENNDNFSDLPEVGPAPAPVEPPRRKRSVWRVLWGIFTALSVLANVLLFLLLIGLGAMMVAGEKGFYTEQVIEPGPRTAKIVVINITGLINEQLSQDCFSQFKAAAGDKSVKGLIIRVNSPGGMVSASDQIYNEINKYRNLTGKPIVGFMQAIATSGGYYASVACDAIVAEPTAITGSIGVIMGHFVFRELLSEKLGIEPVVIKSGRRKDWPSPFEMPDEEQMQYLEDKIITPAYERFVEVIIESRPQLDPARLKELADGSIFSADEALEESLIDEIGYLDRAIETAKSLAGIKRAQVVEYRRPFSLSGFLTSQGSSILKIDRDTLHEFNTPRLMYIWNPY